MEYSVRMRENRDKKNSEYGHFSRCGLQVNAADLQIFIKIRILKQNSFEQISSNLQK